MLRIALSVAVALSGVAAAGDDVAADFTSDAKIYYREVACGPVGKANDQLEPLPADADKATIDKHCDVMAKRYAEFQKTYAVPAEGFFAPLRPTDLSRTVVYPFGGGDLASALVTYPNATDITTISLEHAGDPTRLGKLNKAKLREALGNYRDAIDGLLSLHDSTSENMRKLEVGGIPGQLSFHITGMTAMGYEPVKLSYFSINDDGTLHYLSQSEIEALSKKTAKKLKGGWVDTDFSPAFTNMELQFRKAGDPKAPLVTHRHIAFNLGDKAFKGSGLQKYLEAKGQVVAMTKAASYLIWNDGFSGIRDFLLAHMQWMVSDSTGIAPRWAKKGGFTQTTYGTFEGAFLDDADKNVSDAMVEMWKAQPKRRLPFRYGYPDNAKHVHLMITAPKPNGAAKDSKK